MNAKLKFTAFVLALCCSVFAGTIYAQSNKFAFPYAFSAEDLYGKTVTEKSLGEKEVFFVHYFATWCPPCVREIPDLATIAKRYGDRVGFIALLDDYQDNKAAAIRLAENAGIPFFMVDAEHRDFRTLLKMVQSGYVPTTILIGRDGKVIGEQIVGAYGRGYASFIDKALAR
jgi:thiol-disulfide isomerase/thioredoxin